MEFELLGSCLMDMAKMGLVSEAKVDSFNLPIYYTSPKELTRVIERNGYFNIERIETLNNLNKHVAMPNLKLRTLRTRAVVEGMIEKHFGSGIMDEIFEHYSKKVAESSFFLNPDVQRTIVLFVFLKRNVNK